MNSLKYFIGLLAASAIGGAVAIYGYANWYAPVPQRNYDSFEQQQKAYFSNYSNDTAAVVVPNGLNFVSAADKVKSCVVHIRTSMKASKSANPHSNGQAPSLEDLFGGGERFNAPEESSGSGVIIGDDGYIATNHHVIAEADEITVILQDKRSYKAKLVGSDPSTDLALLKINEIGLPIVRYGNSDKLLVGEWVLAVGNPFDLTSTVTAGIVSAKSRSINVLRQSDAMAIESFIQTDAAVNPGNSGGALVNLKGELVGINTAIASRTGYYSGYSFAVPAAMVRKVMDDFLKYGTVQRALLGVVIMDINAELAKEKGITSMKGVYIGGISPNSAASAAKLENGDIILKVNEFEVNSASELQEIVARYRPGEKVVLTYLHNDETLTTQLTLKSSSGDTRIQRREELSTLSIENLGATLQTASRSDCGTLGIAGGVKVISIEENGKLAEVGIQEGFVITHADKKPVKTPQEIQRIVATLKGGLLLEGVNPDGRKAYYALGW